MTGKRLILIDPHDGSGTRELTLRDCLLPGRLVLDYSRLTGVASLNLTNIRPPDPTDGEQREAERRRIPTSGGRAGPSIVVICPSDQGRLTVSCDDLDLDALTFHHAKSVPPTDAPHFHIGALVVRDCRLGALEAARIRAHDISIRGLACDRRVLFSEAIVEGAFELEHAEVGDLLQLPGRAGHVWVRRSKLGSAVGAAMVVDGAVVFERTELAQPGGAIRFTGSHLAQGFALLQSKLGGDLSLRDCTAKWVSLEDSTVRGATSVVMVDGGSSSPGEPASRPIDPATLRGGTMITASRCDFKGTFALRSSATTRTGASAHRPPVCLYAASSSFRSSTRLRLTGPSVFDHCRFSSGAIVRLGSESWLPPDAAQVTLDLTRSWSGAGRFQVSGATGYERLIHVDDFAAEELRLERLDLKSCQLSELRVAKLSIGSDVQFDRRYHPAWQGLFRHPFALQAADETFLPPASDHVLQTFIPGAVMASVPWASPGFDRRLTWAATPASNRVPRASSDDPLAEPKAHEHDAEQLAQIYQSLSTAFDVQGDAAMSADFYWQHTRWRRKHLGRAKQLANTAYAEQSADGWLRSVLRRARRAVAGTPLGGVGGTWLTLGLYECVLGSGVRARTIALSFAALWLVVAVASWSPALAPAYDTRPACAPLKVGVGKATATPIGLIPLAALPRNVVLVAPTAPTSSGTSTLNVGPPCWSASTVGYGYLGLDYVLPIATVNPHVAPPGSFQRGLFYAGHLLGALFLAFFGLALRAKVRPRGASSKATT